MFSPMPKCLFALFLVLLAGVTNLRAYGPDGHKIVGAIADRLLTGTSTAARVKELLDGYDLEDVAIMADTIKQWDTPGIYDPKVREYFSSHPHIAEQLRVFWKANPPTSDLKSAVPSHHWFHYTDVPLVGNEKYADGQAGRSRWDLVHMMRYCIEVLQGSEPENNPRRITKTMAVILLAHYVGDVHQPLHVGAQYFDAGGNPANPDTTGETYPDEGGNSLHLQLAGNDARRREPKLHGFWDSEAVLENLPRFPEFMPKEERREKMHEAEALLVDRLARAEPKNWRLSPNLPLADYPEAWANQILPIAREAYGRLSYEEVKPGLDHEQLVARGEVVEKPAPGGASYDKWAAGVVLEELHLAGWRLADLLTRALGKEPSGS